MKLNKLKNSKQQLTALTAYDSSFAKLFDLCGIDIILIGDSLGNVIKGDSTTLGVSMKDMMYHTENVSKSCENALIMSDMPYKSYENPKQALENAKLLLDCGAEMIKIEGGNENRAIFEILIKNNIQVCGHLGLQPQSVESMGYKVQGANEASAKKIIEDAELLEKLGVSMLVLECIPFKLSKNITNNIDIITIGIGAGKYTNGQILVGYDMLGITQTKLPKFVKNFGKNLGVVNATYEFIKQVKNQSFPSEKYSYG